MEEEKIKVGDIILIEATLWRYSPNANPGGCWTKHYKSISSTQSVQILSITDGFYLSKFLNLQLGDRCNVGFGPTGDKNVDTVLLCRASNCQCIYPWMTDITQHSMCFKNCKPLESKDKSHTILKEEHKWASCFILPNSNCHVCEEKIFCSCEFNQHLHNQHSQIKWSFKNMDNYSECVVCMDKSATHATLNCKNHVSTCSQCCESLKICPLCRQSGDWINMKHSSL